MRGAPGCELAGQPAMRFAHAGYEAGSIAGQDDILHDRIDLVVPALAAEHAVVADADLHVVALEIGAQAAAQVVGGERLADRADVVALALDGEQHGAADGAWFHRLLAPLEL